MRVLIKIAWRNIWRNTVRSSVIITSVILGLWVGTFINALYYGMGEDRVRIAVENEISHIQIHHPQFKADYKAKYVLDAGDGLGQTLKSNKNIKAWSARTKAMGMIANAGSSGGAQINGIEPLDEDSTSHLGAKIIEGHYLGPGNPNQVLVGAKLAKKMKLKLKSKVVLTFLDKQDNIASGAFRVEGIFKSNNSTWDEGNVFVKREELNPLMQLDSSEAHEVAILLNSSRNVDTTEKVLKAALPNLQVESWMEIAPELNVVIALMSQVSVVLIIIILLALSFGIINTMLMAVLERTREIGMMIALGMNRGKVFLLVVLETFFLVMTGCPAGMLIAWGTISWLSRRGLDLSSMSKQTMESMGMRSVLYPDLPLHNYLQIIGLVIIAALLSAIFPALKALKLNPAETIKA